MPRMNKKVEIMCHLESLEKQRNWNHAACVIAQARNESYHFGYLKFLFNQENNFLLQPNNNDV